LKQRAEVLEQDNRRLSDAKESHQQSQGAFGLSNDFGRMVAVLICVGIRVIGGLSAQALRVEIG
jgi:hypothetical protein